MFYIKMLKKLSLTIFCLIFCVTASVSSAIAGSEDVVVTKVTRITPPDYRAGNIFYGVRDWGAWNKDNTRLLLYENTSYTHPVSGKRGRGLVWGFISDFKSWTDTADYESKIKPLPSSLQTGTAQRTDPSSVWWSIFPGEENILYIARENGWIVKFNVDTNIISNVIYFKPDGIDISNAKIYGWTKDNTLVMSYGYENWTNGGVEIDVQTPSIVKTISSFPWDQCSAEYRRWPDYSHGHTATSPDRSKFASRCDTTTDANICIKNLDTCQTSFKGFGLGAPNTHFSWRADEGWFISNTGSRGSDFSVPTLYDYSIHQTVYDNVSGTVTHNLLFTQSTAHSWINSTGTRITNYHAHFISTLRKDGRQVLFTSTDGKYSYEDCQQYGSYTCPNGWSSDTWGFEGWFLVDLAPVSDSVSQTCTSFTYSDWGACQSNNTQTRTITSSSPSGCTGGTPVLTQSCTYSSGTPALTILKTTSAPTIDGNLTEYNNTNSITFSPASGGNTVTVKSLWTSEALYLGVNVTDTQLNASATTRDGSVWSDDSVEWFIDTYYDGGGSSNLDSAYMKADDYQGIVSIINTKYDSQGTTSGTPTSSWNGTWQSAVKLSGTANTTDTDTGYSIEIKIPWTSIGYSTAPSSDALVGMSFAINDKDSGGTYSKMWLSSAGSNQNASNWQKVSLSGTLATADVVPPAPPGALIIR